MHGSFQRAATELQVPGEGKIPEAVLGKCRRLAKRRNRRPGAAQPNVLGRSWCEERSVGNSGVILHEMTLKFFCTKDIPQVDWKPGNKGGQPESGPVPSTADKPSWWSDPNIHPAVVKKGIYVHARWNCCCSPPKGVSIIVSTDGVKIGKR